MARRGKSGPGYASLIIFIVLCLALIGAYVPLVMAYVKRADTLNELQNSIRVNLEEPLGKELNIHADYSVVSSGQAAYGDAFFQTVARAAKNGIQAEKMIALLGTEGPDHAQAMIDFVNALENPDNLENPEIVIDPAAGRNLKWYVTEKKQALDNLELRRSKAVQAEERYKEEARLAGENLAKAEAEYRGKISRIIGELARAKEDYKQKNEEYRGQWRKANEQQVDWANRYRDNDKRLKERIAQLNKVIKDSQSEIEYLKTELAKKKPKAVKVETGVVLKAEAVEKLAIIDKGRADGIQVGERFIVMRPTEGGEYVPKGTLKVVRVDPHISRADIIQQDEKYLVMVGDIVHREKKAE